MRVLVPLALQENIKVTLELPFVHRVLLAIIVNLVQVHLFQLLRAFMHLVGVERQFLVLQVHIVSLVRVDPHSVHWVTIKNPLVKAHVLCVL